MLYSKDSVFVVFPDCVQSSQAEELWVDLVGSRLEIVHNGNPMTINLDALAPCSSTQVVTSRAGDMVLYNYRELLMIYGLKPLEFLQVFRLHGWVQVDKTHRGVFVKIFCPQGQQDPRSSRTDWSRVQHVCPGELHPVDRKNSWAFTLEDYQITGRVLHVTGTLWKSPLWKDEILYFNHGGQAIPLKDGENSFNLLYVPGEDAYVGTKYSRYVGRRIELEG